MNVSPVTTGPKISWEVIKILPGAGSLSRLAYAKKLKAEFSVENGYFQKKHTEEGYLVVSTLLDNLKLSLRYRYRLGSPSSPVIYAKWQQYRLQYREVYKRIRDEGRPDGTWYLNEMEYQVPFGKYSDQNSAVELRCSTARTDEKGVNSMSKDEDELVFGMEISVEHTNNLVEVLDQTLKAFDAEKREGIWRLWLG